jgi:hypothetical protein
MNPPARWTRCFVLLAMLTGAGACVASSETVRLDMARTTAPSCSAESANLVSIADMHSARASHSATTLADGRVLIVGGFSPQARALGAELFDPATERFVEAPRMQTPRHSHTATLLADGRVLIVGGYDATGQVLGAVELFDPVANAFSAVSTMHAPRAGHIAIRLDGGRVLIAGGVGSDWQFLSSALLFDPQREAFALTGDMIEARESHVGVRLQDGRVWVVGGHRGRRAAMHVHASTEVYDPKRGRFQRAATLQTARHKHDAVLLKDGRVMVLGGANEAQHREHFNSTEIGDPASDAFAPGPRLVHKRYKLAGTSSVLPDGRVLVTGGASRVELCDLAACRTVRQSESALFTRQFSATALLNDGRVLMVGGYDNAVRARATAQLLSCLVPLTSRGAPAK